MEITYDAVKGMAKDPIRNTFTPVIKRGSMPVWYGSRMDSREEAMKVAKEALGEYAKTH